MTEFTLNDVDSHKVLSNDRKKSVKTLITYIGFIVVVITLLASLDLFHLRVYVGVEDRIIIPKKEYDELRELKFKYLNENSQ